MSFRIRTDAKEWFKDLREKEKAFRTDFDAYYFCFLAGIAARRKTTVPSDETEEFIRYFPDRYSARGKLLVALFLTAELQFQGVAFNEKQYVHSAISGLVDPTAQHYMTEAGVKEFNRYANGGFDVLVEWFEDKPRSIETFLRMFKIRLDEHLNMANAVNV